MISVMSWVEPIDGQLLYFGLHAASWSQDGVSSSAFCDKSQSSKHFNGAHSDSVVPPSLMNTMCDSTWNGHSGGLLLAMKQNSNNMQ